MTTESYVAILFLCPGFHLYVQVLMKPAAFRMDQLGRADWDGLIWMLQPGWSGQEAAWDPVRDCPSVSRKPIFPSECPYRDNLTEKRKSVTQTVYIIPSVSAGGAPYQCQRSMKGVKCGLL